MVARTRSGGGNGDRKCHLNARLGGSAGGVYVPTMGLHMIEDAGHYLTFERPAVLERTIRNALK